MSRSNNDRDSELGLRGATEAGLFGVSERVQYETLRLEKKAGQKQHPILEKLFSPKFLRRIPKQVPTPHFLALNFTLEYKENNTHCSVAKMSETHARNSHHLLPILAIVFKSVM